MKTLLYLAIILITPFKYTIAQHFQHPQNLTQKFRKENKKFNRFAEKEFVLIEGRFTARTFEGADSVNLVCDPIVVSIPAVYLSKTEVSVKEYFTFYKAN